MISGKFSKHFIFATLLVLYFAQVCFTCSLQAQNILKRSDIIEDPSPAYSLTLPQVDVNRGKEDPAYAIMRRAVAAAPLNRMPLSMYEAKVYSKATLVIDKIPRLLRYAGNFSEELKKLKEGDVYTQEQLMRIISSKEQFRCIILSRKSSFPKEFDGDFSSDFISLNPYQTGEIISPVSQQGFATYKFRMQNILTLPDYRTVYRIEIIPRIKSPLAFSGTVDILDSVWSIVGFNYTGKIDFQVFSGTYILKQNYREIERGLWVPDKANLSVNASAMGIKATMKLSASSTVEKYTRSTAGMRDVAAGAKSNIATQIAKAQAASKTSAKTKTASKKIEKIDEKLDEISEKEKLSTRDALKIMSLIEQKAVLGSGNEKDELEIKRISYNRRKDTTVLNNTDTLEKEWAKARNDMPLEKDELASYQKDSVSSSKKPKLFNADGSIAIGSAKNKKKKEKKKKSNVNFGFSFSSPLLVYKDKKHNIEYRAFTIKSLFGFNPVDGVLLIPDFSLEKKFSKAKGKSKDMELRFELQSGYAFASKFVPAYSSLKWLYAPRNAGSIKVEGGTWHSDFNTVSQIHPYHVAWSALLGHRNHAQFYHRSYIKATNSIEIFNGFDTRISFDYEWRNPLKNNTEFSIFFPKNRKYKTNIPVNASISDANSPFLAAGQTAHTEVEISYTPKRYYRLQGNKKISLHSNYPTISALWRKGFSLIGGNNNGSDFDYLQLSINQTIHKTMLHTFRYKVYGGYFPNNSKMHFSEFAHAALMGTVFLEDWFGSYQVLRNKNSVGGNYRASTNEWIAGAFFNYDAMYLLIKWIPGINNTFIRENLYLSYLETPTVKHYLEVGYSINKIFMFADIGVSVAFEQNSFPRNAASATKGWGYSGWRLHLRLKLGL